jgi:PAS domain S-box-containing protein
VPLSRRAGVVLLEATEAAGFSRAEILAPLGLSEADLLGDGRSVDGATLASLVRRISELVGGDVERLRSIGRKAGGTSSSEPLGRIARSFVSVRMLYQATARWLAPASVPHFSLRLTNLPDRRLRVHGELGGRSAPGAALFHLLEGCLEQLPQRIGLPAATILDSRITPRTMDLLLQLPRSRTLLQGVRDGATNLLGSPGAMTVLEERRRELAANVEALQRARDDLRLLLDHLPDLVLVHVSGTIVWANRAFVTAMGYQVEDGAHLRLLDIVADPSKPVVRERMLTPVEKTGARSLSEVVLKTRTGDLLTVELAPTQAVVFDGVPARLVVGRDITERIRMQQKLVVADRLASVGLLAAGVAHEVNNPLAYVLNNVEIARKELAALGADAERARDVLSVALEGVARIRASVQNLLLLARGDAGAGEALDVRSVVASTLALAARDIERTARLVRDFQPTPLVSASESRVALVLLNLVDHALDEMRGRPREENELRVSILRSRDRRVAVEVSDTGRGVSEADLTRIFEPFLTTTPSGQRSGAGLAIAQRLVLDMRGELTVESRPERGTTFRVLLPEAGTASDHP